MKYQTQLKVKGFLKRPLITYLLLAVTAIVFIVTELDGGSQNNETLIRWGAMHRSGDIIRLGQYWRFFTPMFLHIGWMHFILNMVTLYFIGMQVESIYGHWRYLLIYVLSGFAGNVASFSFGTPEMTAAGASTALFGLFGSFIVLGRQFKDNPAINYMVRQYSVFIVINLAFNLFSSSVDILGHIGGLVGGVLVATIIAVPNRKEEFNIHERIISAMVFVFLLVISLVIGLKTYGLLV